MAYDQDALLSGIAKTAAAANLTAAEIGALYPSVFPALMTAEHFYNTRVVPLLGEDD